MDNIFDIIPKDKFDNSNIEILRTIDEEEIGSILGNLLEWIQDINWPVAKELIDILPRFHYMLVPHIKTVFNSNDEIWKCWVLCLIKKFPIETVELLAPEIKRISNNPTVEELHEGVDEYALQIIQQFDLS